MRGYCKTLVLSSILLAPLSIIFSGYDSNLSKAFLNVAQQQKVESICTVLNLINTWDFAGKNIQQLYKNSRWSWDKKVFSRVNKIVDSINSISVTESQALIGILTSIEKKFQDSQNHFKRNCLKKKHANGKLLCRKLHNTIIQKSNGYAVAQLMRDQVHLQEEQHMAHNELQAMLAYVSPENLNAIKKRLTRENTYIKKRTQRLREQLNTLQQKIDAIGATD